MGTIKTPRGGQYLAFVRPLVDLLLAKHRQQANHMYIDKWNMVRARVYASREVF